LYESVLRADASLKEAKEGLERVWKLKYYRFRVSIIHSKPVTFEIAARAFCEIGRKETSPAMMPSSNTYSSYRHLAIIFFFLVCLITIGRELFKQAFGEDYITRFVLIFAPATLLAYVLALRILYVLKVNKKIFYSLLVIVHLAILFRLATVLFSAFFKEYFSLLLISPVLFFVSLLVVMYFICVDLFSTQSVLSEKLWASVCVYFLIAVSFGSLYSAWILVNPMALGMPINHPLEVYISGIIYSLNIISGFDPVYDHAIESVKMIAVLESSVATLYLVILIGRLLGMPGVSNR
jgi:hypothetical protein